MKKVVLTTGGTGGHIYPALSVADELKSRGVNILFVGTSTRMENKIIPNTGYRFIGLDIYPLNSFRGIIMMIKGIFSAIKILKEENPDAVIGFGNYISIPVLIASIFLRKKMYLQEQNADIGGTNKFFYKFSKKMFLAFESSYDDVPSKYSQKLEVTGNPLRKEIKNISKEIEREKLGLTDEKVILITGGSLGAKDINDAVIQSWESISADRELKIFWATGEKNFQEVSEKIGKRKERHIIKPYFENMVSIMAASDLVICRAGALTISELIQLEKPSILVPYNSVKVGQFKNAEVLEKNDAAIVFRSSESREAVMKGLEIISNSEQLLNMSSNIKRLKRKDAAQEIADEIDIWGI